jgi:cytochrome c peroxidase
LTDELGGKLFNPPSLRGVSQGGPYFHNGRAQSLEDVFTQFNHQIREKLSEGDLRDLVYFLKSL